MEAPWNIVCFSTVDWHSHRQRPHWVMSGFAERGARVLFVDNLGTRLPHFSDARRVIRRAVRWARSTGRSAPVGPRIQVDSPVVLPLQHLGPVRRFGARTLHRRVSRRIGPRRPLVVWTYLPMPVISDTAEALRADLLVYDWSDDASEHVLSRSARQRARIAAWEDRMAERADVVFVASRALLASRGSPNPNTHVIPHGAPRPADRMRRVPPALAGLSHPMVGFVGSISQWTDLDLVGHLARARPDWQFVMVGPVKTPVGTLRRLPNVLLTGERPHEEIPGYLSAFDAAIIPYRVAPATTAASPVKLREYLAHGLPVVSVDVPEVRPFSSDEVLIASDPEAFVDALEKVVARPDRRKEPRRAETWDQRVDEMAMIVARALSEKA